MLPSLYENKKKVIGEKMELSLFQSAMSKSPVVCDSEELLKNIQEGKWKQEIGELR